MSKSLLLLILAAIAALASCVPPPVPPPRFKPNPPYPPEPVPYNNPPPVTDNRLIEPPPEPQPVGPGQYPTAKRTANPNEVISPYEPYNVIDISGPPPFTSGQLARDPSNQKIFRVP